MNKIGKMELFTIALGSVIGWGAFILPGDLFLQTSGVINTFIGFIIAIFLIVIIEKNYEPLMSMFKCSGGEYTYAKNIIGEDIGHYTGCFLLLAYISIIPLNVSAVPLVINKIFDTYDKGTLLYTISNYSVYSNDLIISFFILLLFTFVQIIGFRSSSKIQNLLIILLILSISLLLVMGVNNLNESHYINFKSNLGSFNIDQILKIVALAPWAFIGFDTVAQVCYKSKVNPKKISFMVILAILFGGFIYNSLNILTALGINSNSLHTTEWATGEAIINILGTFGLMVIGIAMFVAVFSGVNGFFISSISLFKSIMNDQCINKFTNYQVIAFIFVFCLLAILGGRNTLFWFVDISAFSASIAYFFTCLAAYKIASNSKRKILGILGCSSSLFFLFILLNPYLSAGISIYSFSIIVVWFFISWFLKIFFKNHNLLRNA